MVTVRYPLVEVLTGVVLHSERIRASVVRLAMAPPLTPRMQVVLVPDTKVLLTPTDTVAVPEAESAHWVVTFTIPSIRTALAGMKAVCLGVIVEIAPPSLVKL